MEPSKLLTNHKIARFSAPQLTLDRHEVVALDRSCRATPLTALNSSLMEVEGSLIDEPFLYTPYQRVISGENFKHKTPGLRLREFYVTRQLTLTVHAFK